EAWITPANPLEHHRGMFLLFVPIVAKDVPQLGVLGRVHPLLIPVHRFELFHQADDGAVQVSCGRCQVLLGFVEGRGPAGHARPPPRSLLAIPLTPTLRSRTVAGRTTPENRRDRACRRERNGCGWPGRGTSRPAKGVWSRRKGARSRCSTSTGITTRSTTSVPPAAA